MMELASALFVFGILFAAFGLIKHRPDCGSNCGGCSTPCDLKDLVDE